LLISYFSLFKSYSNGEKQEYTGGRTTDTIVQWVTKKSGPPASELKCEDLDNFAGTGALSVVYWGAKEGEVYDNFIRSAGTHDDMKFFEVAGDCSSKHGGSTPGVSVFRNFDESPVHMEGDDIDKFVDASAVPTLITFSEDYIEPIFGKGRQAIVFFSNEQDTELHKKFEAAAVALKGDVLFVQSGTQEGIQ
jgi:protein disulfide-isomerase A1